MSFRFIIVQAQHGMPGTTSVRRIPASPSYSKLLSAKRSYAVIHWLNLTKNTDCVNHAVFIDGSLRVY